MEGKSVSSNPANLQEIMVMTSNVMNYIKEYPIANEKRLRIDNIKSTDGVYPGPHIFDILFEGSRFKEYPGYKGPASFPGIAPKSFGHWQYILEKCMSDLTEGDTQKRPQMELWCDIIRKLIRLHSVHQDKQRSNEINHFYVFIKQDELVIDKRGPPLSEQ